VMATAASCGSGITPEPQEAARQFDDPAEWGIRRKSGLIQITLEIGEEVVDVLGRRKGSGQARSRACHRRWCRR
jgi:hypothetical protein